MSEKRNRERGFFAIGDLAVYAVLALIVVALFLAAAFLGKGGKAKGIAIELDGVSVYTYEFGGGGKVAAEFADRVREEISETGVTVTVYADAAKKEYNVIFIDPAAGTARMKDANCSFHKDCVAMAEVSSERGVIVCVPHKCRVVALSEKNGYDRIEFGIIRRMDKYNRVWITA